MKQTINKISKLYRIRLQVQREKVKNRRKIKWGKMVENLDWTDEYMIGWIDE